MCFKNSSSSSSSSNSKSTCHLAIKSATFRSTVAASVSASRVKVASRRSGRHHGRPIRTTLALAPSLSSSSYLDRHQAVEATLVTSRQEPLLWSRQLSRTVWTRLRVQWQTPTARAILTITEYSIFRRFRIANAQVLPITIKLEVYRRPCLNSMPDSILLQIQMQTSLASNNSSDNLTIDWQKIQFIRSTRRKVQQRSSQPAMPILLRILDIVQKEAPILAWTVRAYERERMQIQWRLRCVEDPSHHNLTWSKRQSLPSNLSLIWLQAGSV